MKYKIITIATLFVGMLIPSVTLAQQNVIFSQYGNNIAPINQAGSLLRPEGEVSLVGLKKWTGIEGAPSVVWANGYAPIKSINATAGLNLRYETVGEERSTDVSAFFAKAIKIGEEDLLALSLNAGVSMYKGSFGGLDANDPVFNNNMVQNTALIGAGVMVYHLDKYYFGISMPRFILNKQGLANLQPSYFKNQFYFTGAVFLKFNSDFKLKPAIVTSYMPGNGMQAEVSAMAYVRDVFGLGMNIRSFGGASGMAQVFLNNFGLGYSYLFSTGNSINVGQINNASHEIALSYRFGKAKPGL